MRSFIRSRVRQRAGALAVCSGVIIAGGLAAGCADAPSDEDQVAFSSADQEVTAAAATGDPLPG
ncbi:MAG: hypothetical protein ACRENC_05715, partial [Gemmatimonadaceae bacterium]